MTAIADFLRGFFTLPLTVIAIILIIYCSYGFRWNDIRIGFMWGAGVMTWIVMMTVVALFVMRHAPGVE
jgi:hypothetical protein